MSGGVLMAHVHGPLSRTNTAPVFNSRGASSGVNGASLNGLSHTMSRSSQMSGSTAYTNSSTTSLSSMTSSATLVPPQASGPVQASSNIINQRADASRSLYQICAHLRQRLALVPGFDSHLDDSDNEDEEDDDVVSSLWRCLRKGDPLLTIYNTLRPEVPLQVDERISDGKKPKAAAFKFIAACMKDLDLPPAECFVLSDLFGDDTTGFVRVTQVINMVLNVAEERGFLLTANKEEAISSIMPGSQMSRRDYIVRELVDTERKYVQDLENLHELKVIIESKGVIPGDVIHDVFLNINAILDFQRRFLIKIERTNVLKQDQQYWGSLFTGFEIAFALYQPFIANQRKAAALARKEFDKIATAEHPVVTDFNTLDGFLLKPMQRLVKYPLLLKELRDNKEADEEKKPDLTAGIEASNRVLMEANAAVDRELRAEALQDLEARVDDWKNHRLDQFGELLLYGNFPVVTGKSEVQKEVRPHDSSPTKAISLRRIKARIGSSAALKSRLLREKLRKISEESDEEDVSELDTASALSSDNECDEMPALPVDQCHWPFSYFIHDRAVQYLLDQPDRNSLESLSPNFANISGASRPHFGQYTIYLFERILLCCKDANPNKSKDKLMGGQKDKKDKKDKKREINKNAKLQLKGRIFMTNVTDVLLLAKQGSYTVQIFWKGDPGVENFIIRFSNEESMKKWYAGVDGQRKQHAVTGLQSGSSPDAPTPDFAWMRDQTAAMPNPYAQQGSDDDEDEHHTPFQGPPNSGMPRNPSSTSLRSRSTTGESSQSLAGIARAPPPRFPLGFTNPPLSLQTQQLTSMPSPGQRGGDSYFSPVAESPTSTRTSTTSSVFPFPRQGAPQGSWEEHNRYTAPAAARAPSRDSSTSSNAYQMNGRTPQRPSLPAMASHSSQASISQQRSRSYSTPDINAQNGTRRLPNGAPSGPVPAVPGIPPHLHPAYDAGIPRSQNSPPNGLPVRTNTQSPGVQRERLAQATQFQNGAPQFSRSNTAQIPMTAVENRTMSPPLGNARSADSDVNFPPQLKVKVNCDGNYVTLVVAFNIAYQSLIDRIDAKVGRFSNNAIATGTMKLRYRDEEGDFISINNDEDIQLAFMEWREAQMLQYHNGQLGEIELFCQSIENV